MATDKIKAEFQVKQLYRDILGREADPTGLRDFTSKLLGGASLNTLKSQLNNSVEGKLVDAYRKYLGREIRDEGRNYWLPRLQGQAEDGNLVKKDGSADFTKFGSLLRDSEEGKKYKALNDIFVNKLGREVGQEGRNYWLEQHNSGMSWDEISKSIGQSAEAQEFKQQQAVDASDKKGPYSRAGETVEGNGITIRVGEDLKEYRAEIDAEKAAEAETAAKVTPTAEVTPTVEVAVPDEISSALTDNQIGSMVEEEVSSPAEAEPEIDPIIEAINTSKKGKTWAEMTKEEKAVHSLTKGDGTYAANKGYTLDDVIEGTLEEPEPAPVIAPAPTPSAEPETAPQFDFKVEGSGAPSDAFKNLVRVMEENPDNLTGPDLGNYLTNLAKRTYTQEEWDLISPLVDQRLENYEASGGSSGDPVQDAIQEISTDLNQKMVSGEFADAKFGAYDDAVAEAAQKIEQISEDSGMALQGPNGELYNTGNTQLNTAIGSDIGQFSESVGEPGGRFVEKTNDTRENEWVPGAVAGLAAGALLGPQIGKLATSVVGGGQGTGAMLAKGALKGAGNAAISQAASGQGLNAEGILTGGVTGGLLGGAGTIEGVSVINDPNWLSAGAQGALRESVGQAIEGDFDLGDIGKAGLMSAGMFTAQDVAQDIIDYSGAQSYKNRVDSAEAQWDREQMDNMLARGMSEGQAQAIIDSTSLANKMQEHFDIPMESADRLVKNYDLAMETEFTDFAKTGPILDTLGFDNEGLQGVVSPIKEGLGAVSEFLQPAAEAVGGFLGNFVPSGDPSALIETPEQRGEALLGNYDERGFIATNPRNPDVPSYGIVTSNEQANNAAKAVDAYSGSLLGGEGNNQISLGGGFNITDSSPLFNFTRNQGSSSASTQELPTGTLPVNQTEAVVAEPAVENIQPTNEGIQPEPVQTETTPLAPPENLDEAAKNVLDSLDDSPTKDFLQQEFESVFDLPSDNEFKDSLSFPVEAEQVAQLETTPDILQLGGGIREQEPVVVEPETPVGTTQSVLTPTEAPQEDIRLPAAPVEQEPTPVEQEPTPVEQEPVPVKQEIEEEDTEELELQKEIEKIVEEEQIEEDIPKTPKVPGTPPPPETPEIPGTPPPETPELPGVPPEIPELPGVPPEIPETPELPGVPPEIPDIPELPEIPPEVPEVPPEIPEVPSGGDDSFGFFAGKYGSDITNELFRLARVMEIEGLPDNIAEQTMRRIRSLITSEEVDMLMGDATIAVDPKSGRYVRRNIRERDDFEFDPITDALEKLA